MPSNHLIFCASFSSCPQSFPASESFLTSQLFASGGQSIGASASASVLLMNIQDWFPLGLTGLISLQYKGLSRVFSSTTVWKYQFFGAQPFNSQLYMTTRKTMALTRQTFVGNVMSLLFNALSRFGEWKSVISLNSIKQLPSLCPFNREEASVKTSQRSSMIAQLEGRGVRFRARTPEAKPYSQALCWPFFLGWWELHRLPDS